MGTTETRFIDIVDDIEGRVPTSIVERKAEEEARIAREKETVDVAIKQFLEGLKDLKKYPTYDEYSFVTNPADMTVSISYKPVMPAVYTTFSVTFDDPIDEEQPI